MENSLKFSDFSNHVHFLLTMHDYISKGHKVLHNIIFRIKIFHKFNLHFPTLLRRYNHRGPRTFLWPITTLIYLHLFFFFFLKEDKDYRMLRQTCRSLVISKPKWKHFCRE